MTSRSRFSLLVALILAGLATLLVRGLVLGRDDPAGGLHGTIVVARQSVPFGTPLSADNLREIAWRSSDVLPGSFATVADVVREGRRLTLASLRQGEPVLASRVTSPNGRASLSTQLEGGMRAVTVRVDEVRGVAGFVLPGDHVDVVLTRGDGTGQNSGAFADLLLQNVKVMAVDQLIDERQDKPTVARAVTLEVSVAQAQGVILAEGVGRLSLVLRQANEPVDAAAGRVTVSDLGVGPQPSRDRLTEVEKRLDEVRLAAESARKDAERASGQRLTDLEARLRMELRPAVQTVVPAAAARTGSVVTVVRNGSKSETYTVAAER